MPTFAVRRLVMAVAIGATLPPILEGQRVSGTVADSATRQPIQGVSITALGLRDSSVLGTAVSDSLGRFSILLARPDSITLTARRIGLRPVSTSVRANPDSAEPALVFEMVALPVFLDTMRTEGKKELKKWFFYKLTAGQEWYARHYRDARGLFTSGPEIVRSGLDACDYLVQVFGFEIETTRTRGFGGVRCVAEGRSRTAVPRTPGRCVEAYIDRKYPLLYMERFAAVSRPRGFTKTKQLPLSGIRGIEVFLHKSDRPKDASFVRPKMSIDLEARLDKCALVLLWTQEYWGD